MTLLDLSFELIYLKIINLCYAQFMINKQKIKIPYKNSYFWMIKKIQKISLLPSY